MTASLKSASLTLRAWRVEGFLSEGNKDFMKKKWLLPVLGRAQYKLNMLYRVIGVG